MRLRHLLAAIVFIAAVAGGIFVMAPLKVSIAQSTDYSPPRTQERDDGWLIYVDAADIGPELAADLNPSPASPEAVVVKFLASRMRGDSLWQETLVADRSSRLQRKIAKWQEWTVAGFQLRGRKAARSDGVYVKVFFRVSIDGDNDEGTDEFQVVSEADGWRIADIPS